MKRITTLLTMAVLLAGTMLFTLPAAAASKTWNVSGVDTFWSTFGNWSPSGAPSSGDNVGFGLVGATAYVTNAPPITNNVVDLAFTARPASLAFNQTNTSHCTLITGSGLAILAGQRGW